MSGRGRARGAHFRPYGRPAPIIEQKLATQHLEIQRLLTENQRFAATHVSLRQELGTVQHELVRLTQEKDAVILSLEAQLEQMRQELHRARMEAQHMNVVHAENEALRQEVHRSRTGGSSSMNQQGDKGKSYDTGAYPGTTNTPSITSSGYTTATAATTSTTGGGNWTVHYAPNGVPYYYNTVTGVTQWERPGALDGTPIQPSFVQQASTLMQLMHAYKTPSQAQTPPVVPLSAPQAQVPPPYALVAPSVTGNPTPGQSIAAQTPLTYIPPRHPGSS